MRFSDIPGRENIKRLLVGQVDSGRLPHALLLWGAEGVGKMALAQALAQYVHCPDRHNGDSCGVCPVCRQHTSLNYPDMLYSFPLPAVKSVKDPVSNDYMDAFREFLQQNPLAPYREWLEVSGAENSQPVIRVSESAEIIRSLSLGNYKAGTKILLLWLPEKLVAAAANKLLKLIEEPQPGRMFIMVSNNPALILPTVFSRLQRIKVEAPAEEVTAAWLTRQGYDAAQASEASEAAQGNPLMALRMLDTQSEEVEFRALFQELMRKAYQRNVKALRVWSENVAAMKREKSRRFLTYLAEQLRNNYLYTLGNRNLTPMLSADKVFSNKFSPYIHGGNVEAISTLVNEAARDIAGNASAKIVLFDFAVQMIMQIKIPSS